MREICLRTWMGTKDKIKIERARGRQIRLHTKANDPVEITHRAYLPLSPKPPLKPPRSPPAGAASAIGGFKL